MAGVAAGAKQCDYHTAGRLRILKKATHARRSRVHHHARAAALQRRLSNARATSSAGGIGRPHLARISNDAAPVPRIMPPNAAAQNEMAYILHDERHAFASAQRIAVRHQVISCRDKRHREEVMTREREGSGSAAAALSCAAEIIITIAVY